MSQNGENVKSDMETKTYKVTKVKLELIYLGCSKVSSLHQTTIIAPVFYLLRLKPGDYIEYYKIKGIDDFVIIMKRKEQLQQEQEQSSKKRSRRVLRCSA